VIDVAAEKAALRTLAKARRADAFARHGTTASARLAAHGLGFLTTPTTAVVSGFSAIRDEIDPHALLLGLHSAGRTLALPAMQGRGLPLVFRSWTPGDEMAPAVWGIPEPLPSRPVVAPDIVLVPLLAFDARGYRLGYGGGFYDRSLAELRAAKRVVAVGIAYDEQLLDAVPHLDYDQPLDWVLTPSGPLNCAGPPHAPPVSR
jgi:5-formyltetrahydrofolate cyclo-ligase